MLKIEFIPQHLYDRGLKDTLFFDFNHLPEHPDEVAVITEIPGLWTTRYEEAFDMAQIQIRARAPSDAPYLARDNIAAIDHIWADMYHLPFFLDDSYVMNVERFGGPPFFLTTDHKGRQSYAGNYLIQVQRH